MAMPAALMTRNLLGACAALASIACLPMPAAGQETRSCSVQRFVGTAQLVDKQGERPVAAGLAVAADDAVRTAGDGQMEIVCSDGITITIGFATHIELRGLITPQPREGSVLLRLLAGIAGFVVPEKTFRDFSVETQTAVAAVRSTQWFVDTPDAATSVFVREGRVGVDPSAGDELTLAAGEGLDISANGESGQPALWATARIETAASRLGFGWQ